MINLNKDSIIYLLCPSKHFTGGPLALHQLGHKLNKMGFKVRMFYIPVIENPINDKFLQYNIPYTFQINDDSNNLLIAPETLTRYLFDYKHIKKAIWWLSIDNFFKSTIRNKIGRFLGVIRKFKFKDGYKYYHFAQSRYAFEFLKSKSNLDNDKLYMLSDYLLEDFLKPISHNTTQKEDIVLYNPKKGYEFTQKLIQNSINEYRWFPIENMTPTQVKNMLLKSKLYVDFGKHPGKDRFPREAAVCGCCIITGKKGSAGFYEDMPIPDEFKFINNESEIENILEKIRIVMQDYESEHTKFTKYIDEIKGQETIFENEIKDIFKLETAKDE